MTMTSNSTQLVPPFHDPNVGWQLFLVLAFFVLFIALACRFILDEAPDQTGYQTLDQRPIIPKEFVWLVPFVTCITYFAVCSFFFKHESLDVECSEVFWMPMIPWLAKWYMPWFGKGLHIRRVLLNTVPRILVPNIIHTSAPAVILPTMAATMSDHELSERRSFFCFNFLVLMFVSMVFQELMWLVMSVRTAVGASHSGNIERISKYVVRCGFILYYIAYQLVLYVMCDIMVAGGFMNIVTGLAWEGWGVWIELILAIQCCSVVGKYFMVLCLAPGTAQQHPALMSMATFMPFFGNELHVFKDHVSQALCFAIAHCSTGLDRKVATCLGYAGFFATIYPLWHLLSSEEGRDALIVAHFPVMMAGPAVRAPSMLSMAGLRRAFTSALITSTSMDKEIRAIKGELPHTILHFLFVFFFGGSEFIYFAIFISLCKIIGVPTIRTLILPSMVAQYGCSQDTFILYWANGGVEIFMQRSMAKASSSDPKQLLREFCESMKNMAMEHNWPHVNDVLGSDNFQAERRNTARAMVLTDKTLPLSYKLSKIYEQYDRYSELYRLSLSGLGNLQQKEYDRLKDVFPHDDISLQAQVDPIQEQLRPFLAEQWEKNRAVLQTFARFAKGAFDDKMQGAVR